MLKSRNRTKPITSHGSFRVGHKVLAVVPPDDLTNYRNDETEVLKITKFAPGKDDIIRAYAVDEDGVGRWLKMEMIVRHAL